MGPVADPYSIDLRRKYDDYERFVKLMAATDKLVSSPAATGLVTVGREVVEGLGERLGGLARRLEAQRPGTEADLMADADESERQAYAAMTPEERQRWLAVKARAAASRPAPRQGPAPSAVPAPAAAAPVAPAAPAAPPAAPEAPPKPTVVPAPDAAAPPEGTPGPPSAKSTVKLPQWAQRLPLPVQQAVTFALRQQLRLENLIASEDADYPMVETYDRRWRYFDFVINSAKAGRTGPPLEYEEWMSQGQPTVAADGPGGAGQPAAPQPSGPGPVAPENTVGQGLAPTFAGAETLQEQVFAETDPAARRAVTQEMADQAIAMAAASGTPAAPATQPTPYPYVEGTQADASLSKAAALGLERPEVSDDERAAMSQYGLSLESARRFLADRSLGVLDGAPLRDIDAIMAAAPSADTPEKQRTVLDAVRNIKLKPANVFEALGFGTDPRERAKLAEQVASLFPKKSASDTYYEHLLKQERARSAAESSATLRQRRPGLVAADMAGVAKTAAQAAETLESARERAARVRTEDFLRQAKLSKFVVDAQAALVRSAAAWRAAGRPTSQFWLPQKMFLESAKSELDTAKKLTTEADAAAADAEAFGKRAEYTPDPGLVGALAELANTEEPPRKMLRSKEPYWKMRAAKRAAATKLVNAENVRRDAAAANARGAAQAREREAKLRAEARRFADNVERNTKVNMKTLRYEAAAE